MRARLALGLESAETTEDSIDDLFSLQVAAMHVPADLTERRVTVRHPDAAEIDLMADWCASFHREALGFVNAPELRRNCSDQVRRLQRSEEHTSELQSHSDLVCRLLLEKKKNRPRPSTTAHKSHTPPPTHPTSRPPTTHTKITTDYNPLSVRLYAHIIMTHNCLSH